MYLIIQFCSSSWLSVKLLWLSKQCILILVPPSSWGCAKTCQYLKGEDVKQHLDSSQLESTALCCSFLKNANIYSPMGPYCKFCWPPEQGDIEVSLLWRPQKTGYHTKVQASFLELQKPGAKQRESTKMASTGLCPWRAFTMPLRYVSNQKHTSQVETIEGNQIGLIYRKSRGLFVYALCTVPRGGNLPRTVSLFVTVPWDPQTQSLLASRAGSS